MLESHLDEPYRLGRKTVRGRFVIPSGIRCTHASTIERCFLETPAVGVVTTKSISAQPRAGYREPIFARYAPGCYINAVGLANPGAAAFLREFDGISIPENKFLLVSIFGSDVAGFVAAAETLKPIADGFELNMSCPHAKGFGAEVGQDRGLLKRVTEAVVRAAGVPVFVKLSSTLADLPGAALAALEAGAAGLTLINTVGPAMAEHGCDAILSNRWGGLSGDGVRPMGLRAVEQVRRAVGPEPLIIGMGGIASSEHIGQYARAGADLFGVGSALTGLDSAEFHRYLAGLERDACREEKAGYERSCECRIGMDYFRTRVAGRVDYDDTLFKLVFESLPADCGDGDFAGRFFFLWIPGAGEKPFAIFSASERSVVVRVVGEFTRRLAAVRPGDEVMLRGPYGRGLPAIGGGTVVHVGGGTGIASLLEIAHALKAGRRQIFLLGARTKAHLIDLEQFERLGEIYLATDDGSAGHHGYVPELLPGVIAALPVAERAGLAFINCGPESMVRRSFEIEREFAPAERIIGSIEYLTSCGVGICGKCASPSGALTCVDGPFLAWREFQPLGRSL